MNEQRNNGKGIFYGVIGVATLIVAIIGATFAYFTATQNNSTEITGNASVISFGLDVSKVTNADDIKGGLIPMTDSMVTAAIIKPTVDSTGTNGTCTDDNGNAVCQIYKITVSNTGTASMFLDGFVNLTGGLGDDANTTTTMRWIQVFTTDSGTTFTTGGASTLATTATTAENLNALALTSAGTAGTTVENTQSALAQYTFNGNSYDYISTNYMRMSGHTAEKYTRTGDKNSALVYNQFLAPTDAANDSIDIYVAVWLSETGLNQNPTTSGNENGFFAGDVVFNSAQGGEVTATFGGYTKVAADTATGA